MTNPPNNAERWILLDILLETVNPAPTEKLHAIVAAATEAAAT